MRASVGKIVTGKGFLVQHIIFILLSLCFSFYLPLNLHVSSSILHFELVQGLHEIVDLANVAQRANRPREPGLVLQFACLCCRLLELSLSYWCKIGRIRPQKAEADDLTATLTTWSPGTLQISRHGTSTDKEC
jgi:hypothetical protein